jgi:uncharacterized protein (TIGR03000 family)
MTMTHRWQIRGVVMAVTLVLLAMPGAATAQKSQPHGLKPSSSSSNSVYSPAAAPAGYQSSYLGPDSTGPAASVHIRVPDNAQVWFENAETRQRGAERDFISPPLTPGLSYTYHVRAQWIENGQPVTRTREFSVRAGSSVTLDFVANK